MRGSGVRVTQAAPTFPAGLNTVFPVWARTAIFSTMSDAALTFELRLAREDDVAALWRVMELSMRELLKGHLTPEQVTASRTIMGLDTQLIEDGTYFVADAQGAIAGCGGWSRRATHFGGDHLPGRDARLLDPATESARVRAMYTHPAFARRGVGRAILAHCEKSAAEAGFKRVALVATMAGLPLYRACGYEDVESFNEITPDGAAVPLMRMQKQL
jgi:GNAT superfamily N-acetyltransferase